MNMALLRLLGSSPARLPGAALFGSSVLPSVRGFATGKEEGDKAQEAAPGTPTYVYTPPGSSMREASYGFSIKDPVYVVDPAPAAKAKAQAAPAETASATKGRSSSNQQVIPPPPASKKRVGLKVDDYASQTYVPSAKGSMHEPRYVSMTDPQDAAHLKK